MTTKTQKKLTDCPFDLHTTQIKKPATNQKKINIQNQNVEIYKTMTSIVFFRVHYVLSIVSLLYNTHIFCTTLWHKPSVGHYPRTTWHRMMRDWCRSWTVLRHSAKVTTADDHQYAIQPKHRCQSPAGSAFSHHPAKRWRRPQAQSDHVLYHDPTLLPYMRVEAPVLVRRAGVWPGLWRNALVPLVAVWIGQLTSQGSHCMLECLVERHSGCAAGMLHYSNKEYGTLYT